MSCRLPFGVGKSSAIRKKERKPPFGFASQGLTPTLRSRIIPPLGGTEVSPTRKLIMINPRIETRILLRPHPLELRMVQPRGIRAGIHGVKPAEPFVVNPVRTGIKKVTEP